MSVTMAARAHSGASLSAPVRRAQAARRKTSWLGRVVRVAGKRPGRAFVLLAYGIVSLAIVANALMFQKARHPAPMLSAPAPVSQPRATAERRAEPAPVQAVPRAAAPAPAAPRAAPARDPIADLINGDLRPPADVKSANRSGAAPRT